MNNEKIAVVGIGYQFENQEIGLLFGEPHDIPKISRKLKRYMSPSAAESISATTQAIANGELPLAARAKNIGLYTSQSGYATPFAEEFGPGFDTSSDNETSTFKQVWECSRVNPFLVTNALNNNLLGITGLQWDLNGDACAFIRDQFGSHGALQEAVFSLKAGYCDVAMVPVAGSEADGLAQYLNSADREALNLKEDISQAAVSLILASQDWCKEQNVAPKAQLTLLSSGYLLDPKITEQLGAEEVDVVTHYIEQGSHSNKLKDLVSDIEAQEKVNLGHYSGSELCPGIVTTLIAGIAQLEKNTLKTGIALDCDAAGFYSLVRIENESL